MTPIERLLAKSIQDRNGCLIFKGRLDPDGYGRIGSGHSGSYIRTHRLSYTHFNGPIPKGMIICHKCDVPACVNPDHLFLGTPLDNARDRDRKGRGADVKGSKNPCSKLTDEQVAEVHKRFKHGETMTAIAKIFNIGMQNVSLIVRGIRRQESYIAFHGVAPIITPPKPRLTDELVNEIKRSRETCSVLAKQFNISTAQVSRIRNNKRSGSR